MEPQHKCEKPAAVGRGARWQCPDCGVGWYAVPSDDELFIVWERTSWTRPYVD